jgi:hypothetical protein
MAAGEQQRMRPGLGPATSRLIAAGGVAGGLGVAYWLVVYIGAKSRAFSNLGCAQQQPWGCLGLVIIGVLAGLSAIALLAWPLLRVAGVRPAWPVALVGPVIAAILSRAYEDLGQDPFRAAGIAVVLAVSYAAAAVITKPDVYRYWSAGTALGVLALYLVSRFSGGL